MAQAAAKVAGRALLKVKLGGADDPARIAAVRRAAPKSELIVDANEGWTAGNVAENLAACAQAGVTLVEQPLPAGRDDALAQMSRPLSVCADESVHASASLAALVGKYDAVNVKLDKAGGLTEALVMAREAERLGFKLMVGCMVATSLAMAPALLLAQRAQVVDLDGALLLARDRPDGLVYEGSLVHPPTLALWGWDERKRMVASAQCEAVSRPRQACPIWDNSKHPWGQHKSCNNNRLSLMSRLGQRRGAGSVTGAGLTGRAQRASTRSKTVR